VIELETLSTEPFPLYLPPDARRLFQAESLLRRFAQQAYWSKGAVLLEFHGSLGGLAIARGLSGRIVVVEPDARNEEFIRERAQSANISDVVHFHKGSEVPTEPFDGVFCFSRVLGTPSSVAKAWRHFLKASGRAGFAVIVRVGLHVDPEALNFWEQRLGEKLLNPREALLAIEAQGYEPELIDSLSGQDLDEHYRDVEAAMKRTPQSGDPREVALKEELAIHKQTKGNSGITYAFVVARRKEPGEKAPASRDNG
jgi:SAM-dependent methyltransferase